LIFQISEFFNTIRGEADFSTASFFERFKSPSLLKPIVDFSVIIYENRILKNNDQKWSIFSQLVTIFEFPDK